MRDAAPDDVDRSTGERLRDLRKSHGLSAKELATRAGVTAAYLSRLETGKLSPTIATLSRLLHAMDESVERLFGVTPNADLVVRRTDRKTVESQGVRDALVTPPSAQRLRVLETVVDAGATSGDTPYVHGGDEECVLVSDGSLRIWVESKSFELGPGDSITFACGLPHRWLNTADSPTTALWIVTPAGMHLDDQR